MRLLEAARSLKIRQNHFRPTNTFNLDTGVSQTFQGPGPNFFNKSAFETMFNPEYYDPKLLFLTFLGNSSATWAKDRNAALRDVEAAIAHLPKHIPCVFMTTAPTYRKKTANQRLKAQ